MAHGTPDYGVTAGALTTHQLTDVGELAARLGSPDTYDRRGDVVWWDDAECGATKWSSTLVGANASFGTDTTRARNGRTSYKLRPGDAINNSALMYHRQPIPRVSRLGLECSFSLTGEVRQLTFSMSMNAGTTADDWKVRWDGATQKLQYWTFGLVYVDFATNVGLYFDTNLFHTAKLVVDAVNHKYHRFILDGITYDMSAFLPNGQAIVASPHLYVEIREDTLAAVPTGTYIDDIIITQNEPANP
jgi:hypothetical protein